MLRLLILCCLTAPALCTLSYADILASIQNHVSAAVISAASSQCSLVKTLFGLDYGEIANSDNEPDLESLSIDFVSKNISVRYNITTAAKQIPNTEGYNPDQKLYLFIHGFTASPDGDAFTIIKNALLERLGDCNLLSLNSTTLIGSMYLRSSTYVQFIGERVGRVLASMGDSGVNSTQIHVIGHSLGAHIASFAAKTYSSVTGSKIGRLTGLDPAGPCFSNVNESLKFQSTDAEFVDVIHTDAGVYGINENVGQVDYWPNGGLDQPNCTTTSCCHGRAFQFFGASIVNTTLFPAVKCDSWSDFKKGNCGNDTSYMGFGTEPGTTGTYYLQTTGDYPYGLGEEGIVYHK